jgi:hypothetical protein
VELGQESIRNGTASGDIYLKTAQALYYDDKKDQARPYYFKALEANSYIPFNVQYQYKKNQDIDGTLAISHASLSFTPRHGNIDGVNFSMPLSQVKSITQDILSDFSDLFRKKKNRRNPVLVIKDSKKNKYVIEVEIDDNRLRSFVKDVIETLKSKG